MCNQSTQLEIMASGGGFDIDSEHTDNDYDGIEYTTPDTLLSVKTMAEDILSNPCHDCNHEHANDPYILDYCHFNCHEPSIIILS